MIFRPFTKRIHGFGFFRQLHLTKSLSIDRNKVVEIQIPVPWGHIAGKWWGDTNNQPILALHGWQDNASTFDPLIKLLPDSISVLAIDLPGHGLSSHFHEGMFYHTYDFVMTCRRIQNYFKWSNLILLGHSGGGSAAFMFSSVYPDCVKALITLDILKPLVSSNSHYAKLGEMVDLNISKSMRKSDENPKYPLQDIENRWLTGQIIKDSLTLESIKILCERGVQFDGESGKYNFTRDPRLKLYSLHRLDEKQCLEMAQNFKCHFLAIKCKDSKMFYHNLKNSPTLISVLTAAARSFSIVEVEGTHHAHLNNPERVAPVISEFIQNIS